MRHFIAAVAALCVFFSAKPCFSAQTAAWEITAGTNAGFSFDRSGADDFYNSDTTFSFGMDVSGGYFVTPLLELLASMNIRALTGDAGHTYVTPTAGIAFNFGDDVANAFVLGGRIGPSFRNYLKSGNDYTVLFCSIFLKKRFALTDHISWSPEVYFSNMTGGTTSAGGELTSYMEWGATPLQFSLLF